MATVRMRVGLAGLGFSHAAGELYECDDAAAARLVAAGAAEWPEAPAALDTTTAPVVETAMKTGGPERMVKPRGKARG